MTGQKSFIILVPDDRLIAARRGQAATVGEVVLGVDSSGSNVVKSLFLHRFKRGQIS
jgi:hypothetical protein